MELTEAFAEYLAEHASNYHGRNVCVTIEDISLAMEPLSEIMTRLSKRLNAGEK
jgi:histone H3/H4